MSPVDRPTLLYDGACPLCAQFGELARARELLPGLEIVSLREPHVAKHFSLPPELRLDAGIILLLPSGAILTGADALLALRTGYAERSVIMRIVPPWLLRCIYPLLLRARRVALALKGTSPIINRD